MTNRSKLIAGACAVVSLGLTGQARALTASVEGWWDRDDRRNAAVWAITQVVNRYNAYGDFNWGNDGNIEVYYNAGVPTAQANPGGNITFGGTWPNERVTLHESNHWMGTVYGHDPNGSRAVAILEQFDGIGARFGTDGTHFWAYGMNYDSEWSEIGAQRNIAITYAFRRDWGTGNPNDPTAWAATNVTLTGSDAAGDSGFNAAWKWSDNTFAHYNADYSTGAYDLRTPQGYPSWKFAGKSLTVNAGGRLLFNGWGTDGQVIMNDLRLAGGTVRHDQFSQDLFQLAGNITLQAGTTSTFEAAQGNIRILAPITGSGSLNFTGANTTTLVGAKSFTGTATVNGGKLVMDGSGSNDIGGVAVSNGGSLRVLPRGTNATTLTTNSLTVGSAGTGTLTLDVNSQSSLASAFINAGAFTLNAGGTVSVVNGGLLPVGQYPAIGYTTLGGTGSLPTGTFGIGGRAIAQWLDNNAGLLSLNVIGNDRPVWTGRDSSNWTTANTGTLKNWKLESNSAGTDFIAGDNVLFDDSATGSTTVSINSGNVSPVGVTFSNSTKSYLVTGSAGIAGAATVTKNGTGTAILSTPNSYTGRTTVNGGVLSVAANNNLGADAAPVTLNGGTLRTTAGFTNTHAVTVGAGGGTIHVNSNGQLFFNTPNTLTGSGPLTVTGVGTLSTGTAWGGNLRIGQTNSYSGAITLNSGGMFEYGVAGAVASGATFTIGNQGELAVQGNPAVTLPNLVTVTGGTNSLLSFQNGDGGDVTGPVTLNAGLTVAMRDWYNFATIRSGKISGKITGPGALAVSGGTAGGTGVLTVTNTNTYAGGTTINANTAVVVGNNAALGTGTVTLNSGGLRSSAASGGQPTVTNAVVVNGSSAIEGSAGTLFRVNGNVTGSGAVALSATYNSSGLQLGGNNSGFTGTATVTGANVRLGPSTAGSAAAAWVVNGNLQTDVVGGGTFDLGSLGGYGVISGHANNASTAVSTLRVGGRNTDSTFNGRIVNNALNDAQTGNADGARNNVLALTKVGNGTLTLGGNNTYTGATTIEGGTLRLANQPVSAIAVANYTFDAVAGTTVTNTGNGGSAMNGTLTSGATVVGGGKSGNALSVSGGANVTVNNAIADLSNNTSWTVSAWVKTNTAGSTILTKSDGGWGLGNTMFYLGDGTGGGSGNTPSGVRWAGGFYQTTASSTSVADNAWHLVTYVNNAGTYAIYTDGVLQALASGNAGFGNADVGSTIKIGAPAPNGDGAVNFNGLLDNVQIYNTALSAQQIAGLVSPGIAVGPLPTTTNVSISGGATFDVNGVVQQVASLNAPAGAAVLLGSGQLIVNGTANSTYGGSIAGVGGSVVKQGSGTLTLSGTGTHTGQTIVSAGNLVLAATDAASKSPVVVNGGKLSLNVSVAGAAIVPALSTASPGTVDLGNDGLIIDHAAGDVTAMANAKADIVAQRITSSLLAGNTATMGIGYARSTDLNNTFRGVTLDNDAVVLLATLYGDADLDGGVSINDFNALAGNFGQATGKIWSEGDFDYDGGVSINDFNLLAAGFAQSLPPTSQAWSGLLAFAAAHNDLVAFEAVTGVPEPGSLGVIAAASALGLRRRRRFRASRA